MKPRRSTCPLVLLLGLAALGGCGGGGPGSGGGDRDEAALPTWVRSFGGEDGSHRVLDVRETRDGDRFVLAGTFTGPDGDDDAWVALVDRLGNVEWSRTVGRGGAAIGMRRVDDLVAVGSDVVVVGDGTSGGLVAARIDPFGSVVWRQSYGVAADVSRIVRIRDGLLVPGKQWRSRELVHSDAWVAKLDPASGNGISFRSYHFNGFPNTGIFGVAEAPDGMLFAAGHSYSDPTLFQLAPSGALREVDAVGPGSSYIDIRRSTVGGYVAATTEDDRQHFVRLRDDGTEAASAAIDAAGDAVPCHVVPLADGGAIFAGRGGAVRRFEADGDRVWSLTVRDTVVSLDALAPGGPFVAGTRDGFVVFDADGNVVTDESGEGDASVLVEPVDGTGDGSADWLIAADGKGSGTRIERRGLDGSTQWRIDLAEEPGSDGANAIEELPNGDFLVAGWTTSAAGGRDAWLFRLTLDGDEVLWQQRFDSGGVDEAWDVARRDDRILAVGESDGRVWVADVELDGRVEERVYRRAGETLRGLAIELGTDGEPIVAGEADDGLFLARVDPQGNVSDASYRSLALNTSQRAFRRPNVELGTTDDGGVVVACETQEIVISAAFHYVDVVRLDAAFDVAWERRFDLGDREELGLGLHVAGSGRIVFATGTTRVGGGDAPSDGNVWIRALHADGSPCWDRVYGTLPDDGASAIAPTSDGGYLVAGVTRGFSFPDEDGWLLKVDAAGFVDESCPAEMIVDAFPDVGRPAGGATVADPAGAGSVLTATTGSATTALLDDLDLVVARSGSGLGSPDDPCDHTPPPNPEPDPDGCGDPVDHSADVPGNLVADFSFEAATGPDVVGGLPTVAGRWQGDLASSVDPSDRTDLVRAHGNRALRFDATTPAGGAPDSIPSEVRQIVDLQGDAARITAGARIRVTALFNRVPGDAETDTRFRLRVQAHDGPPSDHPLHVANAAFLATGEATLLADDCPITWEESEVVLDLPANTTYVTIELVAEENVVDDAGDGEFDGHFADKVALVFLDE